MPRHTRQQVAAFKGSLKPYVKGKGFKNNVGRVIHPLTCPRATCQRTFYVWLAQLRVDKQKAGVKTCPCPHCSKVSLLP